MVLHTKKNLKTLRSNRYFEHLNREMYSTKILHVPLLRQYGNKRSATARQTCIPSPPEDVLIFIFFATPVAQDQRSYSICEHMPGKPRTGCCSLLMAGASGYVTLRYYKRSVTTAKCGKIWAKNVQIFAISLYVRLIYKYGNRNEIEYAFLEVMFQWKCGQKFFAPPKIYLLLHLCDKHPIIRNHYLLFLGKSC